ncbi:glycosyltransferase [Vibrio sp. 10N.261.51.F12]|uniref:glycosyltransferase n=1 Tax=Vibrio sp. 10N.261.51.F12 TaxID=3229679 RepID=UPI003551F160
MRKIKVLHCLVRIGSGGVEQRRLLLAKYLDENKYEQVFLCTDEIGELAGEFRENGNKVICIGLMKNIFDIGKYIEVIRVIKNFKPDIVHGAVFEGNALATVAGTLTRAKIIIAEETSDPENRRWRGHLLVRFFFSLADKAVGVSPFVSDYLKSKLKIDPKKIVTIINGVANGRIMPTNREQTRERLCISDDTFVIGFVGRLEDDVKQVSLLIKVVEKLVREGKKVHLLIVGDGEDRALLEALSNDLILLKCITFVGYQPTTDQFYAAMDLFCLPSRRESFGLVLAEAMFANLPIVASNVGGIPFVVEDGVSGLLAKSGDEVDFYNKILTVIKSPVLRDNLRESGYLRASKLFSEESYCNAVDAFYTDLLRGNN